MEVIVAVFILTVVMASATAFFINNAHSVGGQSQRQNAIYLADQQLEAVRSVPASKLVSGRTSAAVTALHATSGAPAVIAQDDTSGGNYDPSATSASTQEIPTSQTKTVNSVPYTVRTFINRCWLDSSSGTCGTTSSSTTTQEFRISVVVSWSPTGGRACSGGCSYAASTLIDPNSDPKFNTNISQPSITGVSPSSTAVGTTRTLTINGANFINNATVSLSNGGGTFLVTQNFGNQIIGTLTAGSTAGTYVLSVVNPDGGRDQTNFNLNPLPVITTVTPVQVTGGTNTNVLLDGSGFQSGATVAISGCPGTSIASVSFISATQLRLNNVNGTVNGGTCTLTVTNPDTGADTASLVVKSKPTITSVVAGTGPYRNVTTTLTLNGSGFQSGVGVSATNATVSNVTWVSATQVTLTYTATVTGTSTITLTNPDTGTTTSTVNVTNAPAPTISNFTPSSVSKSTNRTFTISGTNFLNGATAFFRNQSGAPVYFNGVATYGSSISLTFVANMGATTGSIPVTVTVTNPDGQTVSFNRNITVS